MVLTRAAELAVSAATRREDVPALRVRIAEPSGGGAPSPVIVETELAQGPRPGEFAVSRGAATVYVPSALFDQHAESTLDLHRPRQGTAPRLVLRGPSAGSEVPGRRRGL
ncbi:hypothetical protein [Actinomycetospora aeridis]|uniref:Uncharacterized protein n=1 Tax=Actinomycetospora aeridis TaxID=3129231 RepID=A0ABU8NDU5_9PSEU